MSVSLARGNWPKLFAPLDYRFRTSKLIRLGRLDLIMEYQVVQEEFRPLFNAEELETASWIMSEIQRGNVFPSTS
jgi:hypothetical protein